MESSSEESTSLQTLPAEIISEVLLHLGLPETLAARGLCVKIQEGVDYWHAEELCEESIRQMPSFPSEKLVGRGLMEYELMFLNAPSQFSGSSSSSSSVPEWRYFVRFLEITKCRCYLLRSVVNCICRQRKKSSDGLISMMKLMDWTMPICQYLLEECGIEIIEELKQDSQHSSFLHPAVKEMEKGFFDLICCPSEEVFDALCSYVLELQKAKEKDEERNTISNQKPAVMSSPSASCVSLKSLSLIHCTKLSGRVFLGGSCSPKKAPVEEGRNDDATNEGDGQKTKKEKETFQKTMANEKSESNDENLLQNLEFLNLRASKCVFDEDAIKAMEMCHGIQQLDLSYVIFQEWSGNVPSSEKQRSEFENTNRNMASRLLGTVVESSNKALTHLDLSSSEETFDDEDLQRIAQFCPNLQGLDVAFCGKRITEAGIDAVAEKCHKLRYFNIGWTDAAATDKSILSIAKNCPSLTYLDCSGPQSRVSDATFEILLQECGQSLQHLDVGMMPQGLTNVGMKHMARHWKNLQYLDIRETHDQITDDSMMEVARCGGFQRLRSINIRSCKFISDDTLKCIALQSKGNLQHLNIDQTQIANAALIAVAENCPNLLSLHIQDCTEITDFGLQFIAKNCSRIQQLHLGWSKVTDKALQDIARYCHQLQYIDVSCVHQVTDEGMMEIVKHCSKLHHFSICATRGLITDKTVELLAIHSQELEYLNVSWTEGKVSSEVLTKVALSCPQLRFLY